MRKECNFFRGIYYIAGGGITGSEITPERLLGGIFFTTDILYIFKKCSWGIFRKSSFMSKHPIVTGNFYIHRTCTFQNLRDH